MFTRKLTYFLHSVSVTVHHSNLIGEQSPARLFLLPTDSPNQLYALESWLPVNSLTCQDSFEYTDAHSLSHTSLATACLLPHREHLRMCWYVQATVDPDPCDGFHIVGSLLLRVCSTNVVLDTWTSDPQHLCRSVITRLETHWTLFSVKQEMIFVVSSSYSGCCCKLSVVDFLNPSSGGHTSHP